MPSTFDADPAGRVRRVFERHATVGFHHGAQLSVYDGDDLVLDLATGTVGPDGPATTPDRRHVLFSCTKPYAGVCLHRLVERGHLDYDDPVRDHETEHGQRACDTVGCNCFKTFATQGGERHD
ncbi:serine hydrolase [Haloplanus natans]|uniref:serine hydrolase n=1 Tax=Haloplanus natans TaxID=376171 RepID=UPI000677DF2E|nr:serine hydrolase domain-containing protein [Haloplanus natans]